HLGRGPRRTLRLDARGDALVGLEQLVWVLPEPVVDLLRELGVCELLEHGDERSCQLIAPCALVCDGFRKLVPREQESFRENRLPTRLRVVRWRSAGVRPSGPCCRR